MKTQTSFVIRKNTYLYLMKIKTSFELKKKKKKGFDYHQQILKSKKKIKIDNQLKNMSKRISNKSKYGKHVFFFLKGVIKSNKLTIFMQ